MIFNGKDPSIVFTSRARRPCLGTGCIDGMIEDENGLVVACLHCRGVGSTDLPIPKRISPSPRRTPPGELTKPLKAAMYDIAEWKTGYCFKQKSMQRLEILGMVEKAHVIRAGLQTWRLSDKGREWLAVNPE